ncbi:MAG: branched-chain amino acid ABC transporter permease [Chloroflexi bacterium]|nr:branched-chain amino acid ABC transporter permease [Chloroflexota bacterium]
MQKADSASMVGPISLVSSSLNKLRSIGLSPLMLLFMVVLALAPLGIKNEYIISLMTVSLLFGTQAMAFDFTGGFINIVNFGFAALVGVGAYTSGLLVVRMGISPAIGMCCGALTAGFLGFLVGALTLRLRGIYASVMAWFLGLALMGTTTALAELTRGNYGLSVPGLIDTSSVVPYYYVLLPLALAIYVLLQVIVRSRIGLAFRAIGQNIDAAQASGVYPHQYKVLNFTVSCACAGLLGGFYAHYIGILTPSIMATDRTIEVLTLAFIGGRGSTTS